MSEHRAIVPVMPTEAMWGGLARDIVMWWCMDRPTGKNLHLHLENLGRDIPAWLSSEIKNVDHVPPEGTVAAAIFQAMISDAPSSGNISPDDLLRAAKAHALSRRLRVGALPAPVSPSDLEDMRRALGMIGFRVAPDMKAPS